MVHFTGASPKWEKPVILVFRLILGLLFLYASWSKILDPEGFAKSVANYRILPGSMVPFVAVTLPFVEACCGICLITGIFCEGAAMLVAGLMCVFVSALVFNLIRGLDISCGCFSVSEQAKGNTVFYLARDGLILLISLAVFIRLPAVRRGSKQRV